MIGVVGAQRLYPAASGGVGHHVQREDGPSAHSAPTVYVQQEQRDPDVPQALEQERRLVVRGEHRAAGPAALPAGGDAPGLRVTDRDVEAVDLQSPGQARGPAVELVVEPVAPT